MALVIKLGTQGGTGHGSKQNRILFWFPMVSFYQAQIWRGTWSWGLQLYCSLPVQKFCFVTWCHGERTFLCTSWLSGEARRKAFLEGRSFCLLIFRCFHLLKRSNLITYLEADLGICETVSERERQTCLWTLQGLNSAKQPEMKWSSLFRGWCRGVMKAGIASVVQNMWEQALCGAHPTMVIPSDSCTWGSWRVTVASEVNSGANVTSFLVLNNPERICFACEDGFRCAFVVVVKYF